jgi:N-acetylglucosamine-6-phosphate deacetylase
VVKIFKLIINELSNAFEAAFSRGKEGEGDSDSWDDDEDEDDVTDKPHNSPQNMTGHSMMTGFVDVADQTNGVEDDDDDDPDVKLDPIYRTDMKQYLTTFIATFAQQSYFNIFTEHLTEQEKQVLQTVGINL